MADARPGAGRQRTLDAVKRLLLRETQERALLLIFADLHWIDSETQALLDTLVDSLGSARLLLVASYRSEYQHGAARRIPATRNGVLYRVDRARGVNRHAVRERALAVPR